MQTINILPVQGLFCPLLRSFSSWHRIGIGNVRSEVDWETRAEQDADHWDQVQRDVPLDRKPNDSSRYWGNRECYPNRHRSSRDEQEWDHQHCPHSWGAGQDGVLGNVHGLKIYEHLHLKCSTNMKTKMEAIIMLLVYIFWQYSNNIHSPVHSTWTLDDTLSRRIFLCRSHISSKDTAWFDQSHQNSGCLSVGQRIVRQWSLSCSGWKQCQVGAQNLQSENSGKTAKSDNHQGWLLPYALIKVTTIRMHVHFCA